MKKVINLILIMSLVFSSTGCMSMWGMGGMHGNMSNQQAQDSGQSQKNTFQNDEFSITLTVPPLFTGISTKLELDIEYRLNTQKGLTLSIEETNNGLKRTVEFDAEGKYPVEYIPKSSGFANITVNLSRNEQSDKLIFVQQKIVEQRDSESIFSKTETYILGGIFMGAMMAVMFFADWH